MIPTQLRRKIIALLLLVAARETTPKNMDETTTKRLLPANCSLTPIHLRRTLVGGTGTTNNVLGKSTEQSSGPLTKSDSDPWWRLDLESIAVIHKVIIYNQEQEENKWDHLNPFDLCLEDNDGNIVFALRDQAVTKDNRNATILVNDTLARSLKIQLPGNNRTLSLAEVEVYASHAENDDNGEFSRLPDEPPNAGSLLGGVIVIAFILIICCCFGGMYQEEEHLNETMESMNASQRSF